MCGRYALALRPAQVQAYLEDENMPVDWAWADNGDHAPRQSYNFAPGYHGLVYRANVPDWGAGPRQHKKGEGEGIAETEGVETALVETSGTEPQKINYEIKSMKWGLIPFWTKRNPDYASMLKTINCRSDSLLTPGGLWTTMKARKRCIVIAQGFYEWLKNPNSKDKVPHYIKRKDDKLMCMAGLWDCVQYENAEEKLYTYTIITTDSNAQLKFLHDRMPVILENGSEEIRTWLDPKRYEWTNELQGLLKPYQGELEIYPVSKEVGKVGNNSPNFIVPIDSSENKNNIANFFNGKGSKGTPKKEGKKVKEEKINEDEEEDRDTVDHEGSEDNAPLPVPKGLKRGSVDDVPEDEPPLKAVKFEKSPAKTKPFSSPTKKAIRATRSATSNGTSPVKPVSKEKGSQKITSFFSK